MQPTISIPKGWEYPRFSIGQRTKQGLIIGIQYYATDTLLAHEYGKSLCSNSKCKIQNAKLASSSILNFELLILNCFGWRYFVLTDKNSEEVRSYFDDQIQLLSVAELQEQLQTEIDQHQQQIKALQEQLAGGLTNV